MMSEEKKKRNKSPLVRRLFDFILNLGMAAPMTCIVCGGFHVAPELQFNLFILLAVSALYLAVMFVFGRNRVTAIIGGVVVVAGTVVAIIAAASMTGQVSAMADVEGNPCTFIAIAACVAVAVHVLSRTYPGSLMLFVLGGIVAATIQFLYQWNYVVLTIVFLVFSVANIVFKYYQRAFMLADAKDTPRYGNAFLAAFITSAVVVAAGAVLFIGINALFHPQALELKPFKEYFAYEVVEITGIADSTKVDNEDLTTDQTNDQNRTDGGDQGDDQEDNSAENDQNSQGSPTEGAMLTYTKEALDDAFDVMTIGFDWWTPYLLAVLLVLLIVVPIVVKKYLRWRWHKQVLSKTPIEQVVEYYLFFLSRLDRIGLGKPESATALAFAANCDDSIDLFEQNGGGTTLEELSQAYTRCAYGNYEPEEGVPEKFEAFYRGFYKSCRRYVGKVKYLFKFFRL